MISLPNADVFFFSERNSGELLSIRTTWGKGAILTDKSELYPGIVTSMWKKAIPLQSLLTASKVKQK
jgi:hypothetical protein